MKNPARTLLNALIICLISIPVSFPGCSGEEAEEMEFEIIQKPIQFDSTRTALSLKYMEEHYGMSPEAPVIDPSMIVVHWTVIPTFDETFEFFDPPILSSSRGDISSAGALNVSSHYLIKRNGEIYQLMPDSLMARHVIGLNHTAIGIENIGSPDRPLTRQQLAANAWLIRRLTEKHDIRHMIGHYEYIFFEHSPLWAEINDGYRTEKTDPGIGFMVELREKVKDLGLKGIPEKAFSIKN